MQVLEFSIARIIRNDDELYDGNLVPYFQVLFFRAPNLRHPYHNLRHMLHVMWLCFQACVFYGATLTRRQVRNLLIAALFHDFGHSGGLGDDDLNIARAIRALRKYAQPEDKPHLADIERIIQATEYPHQGVSSELDLPSQILRDADVSQALSVAWIQQVVIGLATEWSKPPLDVLRAQKGFHASLKFSTSWAERFFPPEVIKEKIAEAEELLALLEEGPAQ